MRLSGAMQQQQSARLLRENNAQVSRIDGQTFTWSDDPVDIAWHPLGTDI